MIDFTKRQQEIIEILKKHEPITAEQIAEMLGVSKGTIRSDLAVLVMTGNIEAKPKVGYFLGKKKSKSTRTIGLVASYTSKGHSRSGCNH